MAVEQVPGAIEPLIAAIRGAVGLAQVALGGIFGLYLLLVVLRWWESRQLVRILGQINKKIDGIAKKMGVRQVKSRTHTHLAAIRKHVAHKVIRRKR